MSAIHFMQQWGLLLSLLFSLFSYVIGDGCFVPKSFPYYITGDLQDVDNSMCYKCFEAPSSQNFRITVHELRLGGLGNVMMYVGGTPKSFPEDCGECETENFVEVDQEGAVNTKADALCHECDALPEGSMVEFYVRLNTPSEGESLCENLPNIFPSINVSLNVDNYKEDTASSVDCDDGLSVSLPVSGDTCVVNSTGAVTETHCITPTCSEGVISPDMTKEKIEHKFAASAPLETCLWQLNTEQRKHLTLKFSENIRSHLIVFEETLLNPKWNIEWCPTFTEDEYRFDTEAASVFVLYRSTQKLSKKGTLTISAQTDLCLLPPKVQHGNVEFKHLESGTVAHYSCDKGYLLFGEKELRCKDRAWDKPPKCLPEPDTELFDSVEDVNENKLDETQIDDYGESRPTNEIDHPFLDDDDIHANKSLDESFDEEEMRHIPYLNASSSDLPETEEESKGMAIIKQLMNLTMEDDLTMYLIIGASGFVVFIIILTISLIIYRKKYPVRLGLGRKFDTFQNPIYEKTVVQMPLQAEETDGGKKSDAEEMSDCTVLE